MVERSRQMYSAQIYKEDFLTVKRIMKEHSRSIEKALEKCNKILLGMKRECENYTVYDTLGNMVFSFMRLMTLLDEFLQKANEFPGKKDVMDFYFELRNFLNIYDLVDEHYVMYSELEADGRFMLKLFCVDPSLNIQKRLDKGKSAVFFSATFLPVNYYKSLLSTKKDNYAIYADSTFDSKKRLLAMATDVSTRYTRRSRSEYERIAGYINAVVTQKTGNYMVFFPSYKMMNDVADIYCEKYADETASLSKSAKKSSVTNSSLADWLFTQDRKAGEVTVIEDTDNSAYIVAYFISRSYDESNNTTIANQLLSQKYNELITGYTDNMSVNNIKNRIKMLSE